MAGSPPLFPTSPSPPAAPTKKKRFKDSIPTSKLSVGYWYSCTYSSAHIDQKIARKIDFRVPATNNASKIKQSEDTPATRSDSALNQPKVSSSRIAEPPSQPECARKESTEGAVNSTVKTSETPQDTSPQHISSENSNVPSILSAQEMYRKALEGLESIEKWMDSGKWFLNTCLIFVSIGCTFKLLYPPPIERVDIHY